MKLVAWFPSRLEDTRALAVVQDCSTATILESTEFTRQASAQIDVENRDYHHLSQVEIALRNVRYCQIGNLKRHSGVRFEAER
jgi:hypothetical protein